jgi:hypothetical protein
MEGHRHRAGRVLLTGDYRHPDFAAPRAFLAAEVELREALVDEPGSGSELIVLCQARPGQFSQEQVERLHASAPLARWLAILGSWCEGEQRSGRPWHGVERVYWYDAVGRLQSLLNRDSPSPASRTLTLAEQIEHRAQRWPRAAAGATAVIAAQRRQDYEPLADICRVLGLTPRWERTWQASGAAPTLLVVAIDDLFAGVSLKALAALSAAWPNAQRIALLNFPRRHEVHVLQQAGFQHVLGKPLLLADLLGCLSNTWGASLPLPRIAAS